MLYSWTAQTKEGKLYPQFNEGKEFSFGLIRDLESKNQLAMLHVRGKNGTNYAVDLRDGVFYINATSILPKPIFTGEYDKENHPINYDLKKYKLRIIFWRRMNKDVGPEARHNGDQFLVSILLGWQTTINDINYQQIMYIYPHSKAETIEFKEKI